MNQADRPMNMIQVSDRRGDRLMNPLHSLYSHTSGQHVCSRLKGSQEVGRAKAQCEQRVRGEVAKKIGIELERSPVRFAGSGGGLSEQVRRRWRSIRYESSNKGLRIDKLEQEVARHGVQ